MNTQLETKIRKIESTSVVLRRACTALLVLAGAVTVFAAVAICSGRATGVSFFSQSIAMADLSTRGRMVVTAFGLLTSAVIIKGLYHLRRLLDNYSRREIFTIDSTRQIRQFGFTCMFWGGLRILWAFLPMMLLPNPPHSIMIVADSVATGAVIVVISWFAEMAASLREENDLTI